VVDAKTKKVPGLRFRGFSDEWQDFTLGDLFTNKGGTALEDQVEPDGSHKFISIGNYTTDGRYIDNGQRVNLNQKTKDKQLNINDLVMVLNDKTTAGDLIGSTILIDADSGYVYNQRSERIICSSKVTPKYSWFVLNTRSFRKKIYSISQGGTQIYVNFPIVKKLTITIPLIKEQLEIAGVLGVVDDKISALQGRKELLEKYKKGMMQKIFSQKIRFKDENGKDYPVWQEKKLGNIAEIKTGNLNVEDAKANGEYEFFDRSVEVKRYNKYSFDNEALIYPGEGSEFFPRYFKGKYGLHQRSYTVFAVKGVTMKFLYYFMLGKNNHFLKYAVGSTVKSLRMDCFNKCELQIPSLKEQQKIADFLTSLDGKIDLTERELVRLPI
jgi:type I restriction enzyme S subunit